MDADRGSAEERLRRRHADEILAAGLEAIAPAPLTRAAVADLLTRPVEGRVFLLGAGKAVAPMLRGALEALAEVGGPEAAAQSAGVVIGPPGGGAPPGVEVHCGRAGESGHPVEYMLGGHPLPNEEGARGARAMLRFAREAGRGDLVVLLLSGGASSLMSLPAEGLGLGALQRTSRALLESGAGIEEVNTVRKHLSGVAGGRLGAVLAPARAVALVVSDVVGDSLTAIGSGPAYGDPTTFADALEVLRRRGIEDAVPPAVLGHLRAGADGEIPETPDPASLQGIEHRIIARNLDALRAMGDRAGRLGYNVRLLSHMLEGEARELGVVHAGLAASAAAEGIPAGPPCALLTGGEATVTVRGGGRGGRNGETVLAAVPRLAGLPATFLSAGTDGIDGMSDAAGGVVDGGTAYQAALSGVDVPGALAENDSHTALERLGGLVMTGPTGTNVADVRLVLVGGVRP